MGERVGYSELVQPEGWRLGDRALYGKPDLTVFSGLEELTLDDLYEELPWWRSHIVQVLKNSPGLRKLKMSLSTLTVARHHHEEEREKFANFFDELCVEYGEAAAAPLRLRSLHLGTGVYPYAIGCLKSLTDLAFLEEVHVENGDVWDDGIIIDMYTGGEDNKCIGFCVFGPAYCPNLRRFNVAEYQQDVHDFLATTSDPSFTRRLAVSCKDVWAGYEPAALLRPDPNYPSLPLNLRILDIDLQRSQVYLVDEDGDDLAREDTPPAKDVLADLVSGDDGTLEGLAVHLAENPEAEDGFEDFGLLIDALANLVNLSQLAVEANIHDKRLLRGKALAKAAHLLATAAPRLRYIKVYETCWRVWRNREDGSVRLEELEGGEIDDVELFRGLIWKPVAC
jgi:hypothetical protein